MHSLGLGRERWGLMSMLRSIRLRASLFSCFSFSSIRESLCSSDDILKNLRTIDCTQQSRLPLSTVSGPSAKHVGMLEDSQSAAKYHRLKSNIRFVWKAPANRPYSCQRAVVYGKVGSTPLSYSYHILENNTPRCNLQFSMLLWFKVSSELCGRTGHSFVHKLSCVLVNPRRLPTSTVRKEIVCWLTNAGR